jgi:hypothetical protein
MKDLRFQLIRARCNSNVQINRLLVSDENGAKLYQCLLKIRLYKAQALMDFGSK